MEPSTETVCEVIGYDARPSMAVTEAVADAADCPATDLTPLNYSVDCDALDALCSNDGEDVAVTFSYERYRVTVSRERVSVCRLRPHRAPNEPME
jgi:hypothetical protein